MRLVLLSDTHGLHRAVPIPDGDLLLVAGDITRFGRLSDIDDFDALLATLPHPHKVFVAGNHDFPFEHDPDGAAARLAHATVLHDRALEIDGLRLWGSPWQPAFGNMAFGLPRGDALRAVWDRIPDHTDILVTHTPPHGIGDRTDSGLHVGCEALRDALRRVAPRLHVFGHVHEAAGTTPDGATTCVNASVCDSRYRIARPPVVVDW